MKISQGGYWRGGSTFFTQKCLGCGAYGSGKRKWEEGRLRERGRWLQECDPESRSWRRGFPEWFLPLLTLSPGPLPLPAAKPAAKPVPSCLSSPLPSSDRLFRSATPPHVCLKAAVPARPSSSGFRFPHLMWGNPRTGTSPPSCPPSPRLRLFVQQQTHIFCTSQTSPKRYTQGGGLWPDPHGLC